MTTETTKRSRLYVIANTNDRDATTVRVALNPEAAIEINDKQWSTGIRMDRCWFGRNRVIAQYYSIWDDGRGRCAGTGYDVISDPEEILRFCRKAGIEPPTWIPAEEA
jgi:hypothetical protein